MEQKSSSMEFWINIVDKRKQENGIFFLIFFGYCGTVETVAITMLRVDFQVRLLEAHGPLVHIMYLK